MSDMHRRTGAADDDATTEEIIDLLSTILESPSLRILSVELNERTKPDAWLCLATSLDDLVSLWKQVDQSSRTVEPTPANELGYRDDDFLLDNVLLGIESTVHQVRGDVEILRGRIAGDVSTVFALCRRLEEISHGFLLLSMTIKGAIRQQEALTLQSLDTISRYLSGLYHLIELDDDAASRLSAISRQIHRRFIDRSCSPWTEALQMLKDLTAKKPAGETSKASVVHTKAEAFVSKPTTEVTTISTCQSTLQSSMSLLETVKAILTDSKNAFGAEMNPVSLLLVGTEGSGKTYLLNQIASMARNLFCGEVEVICPSLPFDAMGTTVGAAEDKLISMVCQARATTKHKASILILDDIDSVCGQLESSNDIMTDGYLKTGEAHITARLRGLFLTLLDSIHRTRYACTENGNTKLILICSSKVNFGKDIDRFDQIFVLSPPDDMERIQIISSCVSGDRLQSNSHAQAALANLAECTSGLSRAELSQYCRQALLSAELKEGGVPTEDFLALLKMNLQSSTPESLRSGMNSDFVDIRVFSARDLQELYPIQNPKDPTLDLPLFGKNAQTAWEGLRRLIVLPICQGPALDKILFHRGDSHRKVFSGGVLLAGAPGTGKSTLAYYCASFASSINHSIKLIDVSCTSLIHKEVGGSERALHRLFQSARSATPCIVLLDGIENIAAVRGNDNTTEGTMDRVLSTLLTELDGVESEQLSADNSACMAVIGITHNPQWIDPALRRPGRLEQTIRLDNPDFHARKRIFLEELQGILYEPSIDRSDFETLDALADRVTMETEAYTGADMVAICNEVKLLASRDLLRGEMDRLVVTPQLVLKAVASQRSGKGR